ncbi:MAG: DUF6502 family protein [Desulfobacterales bacterium]|nr:DUF6502 family protein [Desulfobacterales bacterium]
MNDKQQKPLVAAVLRLLQPLARILLRNGVSYSTFSDLAKWVFIDVAAKEFGIEGRKQTTSRVSVITGLSRREVMRVRKLPRPDVTASYEKHNRAARVIAAWRREPEFLDEKGDPALLPMEGSGPTFSDLVKRFSGNVPPRAILDELIHVGAVERREDGKVALLTRAYIPRIVDSHKLNILGIDVQHLIATIDHNLNPETTEPRFQRKVLYDNLPDEALPKFHNVFAKRAQSLLENADKWLAQHDRDVTPTVGGTGRNRAGFGIFFFEESNSVEES